MSFTISPENSAEAAIDQNMVNMGQSFAQSLAANYFWDMIYFSAFVVVLGIGLMAVGYLIAEPKKDLDSQQ